MSKAADIFARRADLIKKEKVEAWGDTFWVWALTGKQRDQYESSRWIEVGKKLKLDLTNTRARLVCMTLRESDAPDSALVFTERQVNEVGELDGITLDKIFDVASRLSGLRTGDEEDAVKNSAGAMNGAFSSDSQPTLAGVA